MNRTFSLFLTIAALFNFAPVESEAQWAFLGGPNGGNDTVREGLYPAISSMYVTNCELFAGTPQGLFLSTDGCKTWLRGDSIKPNVKINAIVNSNNTFFAGTDADGIYRLADNGATWRKTNAVDSTLCMTVNDSCLLAGNTQGIQRCRVGDSVWSWVVKKLPARGIVSIAARDSVVFAGCYPYGALRSMDYGNTFSSIDTNRFPARMIGSFAFCGNAVFASSQFDGVYRSADNGNSWTKLTGLSSSGFGDLAVIDSTVFLSTDNSIFFTTDYGTTWLIANSGLENKFVNTLYAAGGELYAGTEHDGVWHRSASEIVTPILQRKGQQPSASIPMFSIRFNGSADFQATITFSLAERMKVKVKVYDIRGHEICSPVSGVFGAGSHSVPWNARTVASGMYMVIMISGADVHTAHFTKSQTARCTSLR